MESTFAMSSLGQCVFYLKSFGFLVLFSGHISLHLKVNLKIYHDFSTT